MLARRSDRLAASAQIALRGAQWQAGSYCHMSSASKSRSPASHRRVRAPNAGPVQNAVGSAETFPDRLRGRDAAT